MVTITKAGKLFKAKFLTVLAAPMPKCWDRRASKLRKVKVMHFNHNQSRLNIVKLVVRSPLHTSEHRKNFIVNNILFVGI